MYETINLHFNSFDLGSEFCHGSWLVIFDGPTADPEKIISQNCGNIAPDDIRSTSNTMTIRLVSNFQTLFGTVQSFLNQNLDFILMERKKFMDLKQVLISRHLVAEISMMLGMDLVLSNRRDSPCLIRTI